MHFVIRIVPSYDLHQGRFTTTRDAVNEFLCFLQLKADVMTDLPYPAVEYVEKQIKINKVVLFFH